MHIFVTDPFESLIPGHDSSLALMREAILLNHPVHQSDLDSISIQDNQLKVKARQIYLSEGSLIQKSESVEFNLSNEKQIIVWMRKDPPVDHKYIVTCQILRLAKCKVINNPNTLMSCDEKLFALEFPELIPQTTITSSIEEIKSIVSNKQKVIVKPIGGKAGEGILVLNQDDKNKSSIIELLTEGGNRKIIVQQFLQEAEVGDKRIFLLNGDPVGVLLRVPSNDYRANMAAGGNIVKTEITQAEYAICEQLKPRIIELGLNIVGIDVIGNMLTEINITSPTCLEEINLLDGSNPAKKIIEWSQSII
ncbi:MAG: glutathione synthase [Candidatus Caenarcaniphilales bacterium]|nr:glutathione synthase [Candidatus Caenarcaniphilales bacterium]